MTTRRRLIDPYNLRLSPSAQTCVSGVQIAPGLVGHCHETPLGDDLLLEQAPVLAGVLGFLDAVREHAAVRPATEGQVLDSQLVREFSAFAERHLGPPRPVSRQALRRLWRLDVGAGERASEVSS
ncbi:MAG: hypothetical protein AAGC60_10780 [Acidobacteriota bacterium]